MFTERDSDVALGPGPLDIKSIERSQRCDGGMSASAHLHLDQMPMLAGFVHTASAFRDHR
jgi:hypothetical protein